jgi:hypothetical protein
MTKKNVIEFIFFLLFLQTTDLYSGWGKGNLTVAESSYHISRFERVLNNWFYISSKLDKDDQFRIIDTNRNYLVIDLDKQALWIEDNGKILQEYYVEFPSGLKWRFYHATPNGETELTRKIYLRIRGIDMNRLNPEMFCLVGQSRNDAYILYQFFYNSCNGDLCKGLYAIRPYKFDQTSSPEKLYGSLLVSDKEYQQYRNTFDKSTIILPDKETSHTKNRTIIEDNKAAWNRIEKELYLKIEKQILTAGYDLKKVTVKPGPDYAAGYAEVSADKGGLIRKFMNGPSLAKTYLKIDYLGNDIWYAKSAINPNDPIILIPYQITLDLEFFISSKDKTTASQLNDLLEKGRKIQQSNTIHESKWKVVCSNGMSLEFIGICENPSFGRTWWGPDGSILDYVPYINTYSSGGNNEEGKIYEIALRLVNMPAQGSVKVSFENNSKSYFIEALDKYGNRIKGMDAKGYVFGKTAEKTTLTLTMKDSNGKTYMIIAKNISLIPGQDQGFDLEVQDGQKK